VGGHATESDCRALVADRIRRSGPITVAEYMEVALYAPGAGYYARAAQRSGRAGDFVTSVDVSPLFGELLAVQIAELWHQLPPDGGDGRNHHNLNEVGAGNPRLSVPDGGAEPAHCHLVEAGAGNGRLSRDILDALSRRDRSLYDTIRLHLVERSAAARAAQPDTLGPHAGKLSSSSPDLPDTGAGVIFANELLDAFPVHLATMTPSGLGEIYVDMDGESLVERLGPPSTDRLADYFEDLGITLHPGATVDVNLAAIDWIHEASRRLARGFLILIDYGYEARTMYADPNAVTTLTAFSRHMADPPESPEIHQEGCRGRPHPRGFGDPGSAFDFAQAREDPGLHRCARRPSDGVRVEAGSSLRLRSGQADPATLAPTRRTPSWLAAPGTRDLTSHVDFTTLRREASRSGLSTLSVSSQSRFLLDLVERSGLVGDLDRPDRLRDRLALKSLLVPGGLGSSHSVLVFGKNVETATSARAGGT